MSISLISHSNFEKAFLREMHDFIVNITGLENQNVRPENQFEPPTFEDEMNWCSFGVDDYNTELGYYEKINESEKYEITDHETISVRVIFYGDKSKNMAMVFATGLKISENWNYFTERTGCRLASIESIINAPELIDEHWISRTDVHCIFRRETSWEYSGLSYISTVEITSEEG